MGQEVGVSALQVAGMVSTIANGGVLTPARLVAGTIEPKAQPQPVVFKPAAQRRVISPLTAVQMKKMMEETVLFGTGRKAILDGYTSAGKTGTAQKTDPATGAYSHTDYVASFAGFAPVNTPAVTIVVIIDSAKGLHQGGQIAAPVFNRIAQQVLEYMNVPHDTEFKNDPQRQLLRARVKEEELKDGAPDHLGAALDLSEVPQYTPPKPDTVAAARKPSPATVAPVSLTLASSKAPVEKSARAEDPPMLRESEKDGTVVINVGGSEVVPSFLGMTLRNAIETAQTSGFEINAIGSGVAREQSPPPGERVAAGARIAVRFAR
jgi:cell division protein FtsI (penicillin-binding protein 3)